jgi:hypothetical protein
MAPLLPGPGSVIRRLILSAHALTPPASCRANSDLPRLSNTPRHTRLLREGQPHNLRQWMKAGIKLILSFFKTPWVQVDFRCLIPRLSSSMLSSKSYG